MSLSSRGLALLLCAATVLGQRGGQGPSGRMPRGSTPDARSRAASRKNSDSAPRSTPQLHLVDAVVVGPGGQPLRDLQATDFALSLNGESKKIASVHYVNAEAGTLAPASTLIALKPDQIHRTLVFIADDLDFSLDGAENVRRALAHFLETGVRPTDLVSIVRTSSGSGASQELTTDRRNLAAAIRAIRYNPIQGREDAAASGARGALRHVLEGLRSRTGRKAAILLSENPALWQKPPGDGLLELAHRASTAVSLIDVRANSGAQPPEPAGLASIAQQTGGRFISGAAIHTVLTPILDDQLGYYLVEYEIAASPLDPISGRVGPQHPVLTTTRADAQIRARNGWVNSDNFTSAAGTRDLWRPSFTTPAADLRRGLVDPFASGAIPVRFVAGFSVGKAGSQIDGTLYIDPKDLTYTHWLSGRTALTLDVQMAAFDESGQSSQNESHSYVLQLSQAELQESRKNGFTGSLAVPVHAAGAYQVRAAVRDGTSGRIGSAAQFVEVPETLTGKFAIGGVTMYLKDDPAMGLAALHVFEANHTYGYTYQILNATANENKRAKIEVQSRILRDGEIVFGGTPTNVEFSSSDDPRRRTAGAEIKLAKIDPGFYLLQIVATDKLAKEPRTATSYTLFEVK